MNLVRYAPSNNVLLKIAQMFSNEAKPSNKIKVHC